MADEGKLRLTLTDVHGRTLAQDVIVSVRNQRFGDERRIWVSPGRGPTLTGLRTEPNGGVHRIAIDPPSYRAVGSFVSIAPSGTTEMHGVFPVDPDKVLSVVFPSYATLVDESRACLDVSANVLGFEGRSGATLYAALDNERRAGLLNIVAKTRTTVFAGGQTVLSFVRELTELRRDRFFAVVAHELREETKNASASGLFEEADESQHHPPAGFDRAGSFKTADGYGNLQLTFFVRSNEWRADIDIDDAAGLGHVFQVLRNTLTGRPTHPYDIHEILVHHQKLDPGYTLVV
ncbi:MAG: hypothetical protein ABR606_15290 [Vicinamibacterales bacterium]